MDKATHSHLIKGYIIAICGGLGWAIGGACGQILFRDCGVDADWLVPIRMFLAGLMVLAIAKLCGKPIGAVWRDKAFIFPLLVFALIRPVTVLGGMEPASAKMCFHMVTWITLVKPIVWTLAFVPAYGLRAAGDVKFSMITSCLVMWLCRFCLCVILIRFLGFGPMGVWIGMFADWTVRAVIFTWRFHSRRWLRYKVI